MAETTQEVNGFLKSTFPVFIPADPLLTSNDAEFEAFLKTVDKFSASAHLNTSAQTQDGEGDQKDDDDSETLVSAPSATTSAELRAGMEEIDIEDSADENDTKHEHPFMKALHSTDAPPENMENIMLTENADLAHRSTTEPLLDLFTELEDVFSGVRMQELLSGAWKADSLSTLKIIFNARSIHIGKSSRPITYKCFGWLAENHPATLLLNLQWLSRPIIEKKLGEKKEGEADDMVLVEAEKDENDPTRFDVKNGVAHGYWKDLLNILALAANGKLNELADPRDVLNIENKGLKSKFEWNQEKAKQIRKETKEARHARAIRMLEKSSFYRALHLTVARLFAEQLKLDLALLKKNDKKAARQISLCAKWAPSLGLFHDKHTFVVSSIAEILHPHSEFADVQDRELYLRHAREAYRKDISSLRKSLEVVERDIAAANFTNIQYEQVPSLAMNRYAGLFAQKDSERFDKYLDQVTEGSKTISGAVLMPSKLISTIRAGSSRYSWRPSKPQKGVKGKIEEKKREIDARVIDEQWKTLVKRMKDSGKLENSIAVCDVSGSMCSPQFPDGTCPMDSAISLSLILAEVTAPPFGGTFITFSEKPTVQDIKGNGLKEQVENLESSSWGMSTDVVAVFRDLILPLAKKHKVKQEDMVKQVFIFSDMQFNQGTSTDRWSTSYGRIKEEYADAGYEMPSLVFWNLAGGRAGVTGQGDPTAPKPVTAADEGTSLVSGYSQGMLKVFLDNGSFEDPEAEEELVETVVAGDDDEEEIVQVKKKQKVDPMSTLRKAISHKSYSMLKVID